MRRTMLMLTVVLWTLISSISFAAESEEITLFGIALDKSLQEVGIRECTGYGVKDRCYSQPLFAHPFLLYNGLLRAYIILG